MFRIRFALAISLMFILGFLGCNRSEPLAPPAQEHLGEFEFETAPEHYLINAINELRDIAHVIDMKQLTKDPDTTRGLAHPTAHSPERSLDAFALGRYLDYCTEMLSLTSKLGYLYVENFHDTEVTKAATELENLCSGLARKIWQKIIILR